jgi:hypothetical protein
MADVAHTRLLLVAVSAANKESAAARAEAAQAKTKAKEAKREAKLAIREMELVKADAKKAEGVDTVAHIFSPKDGETSESFRCGGIEFSLKLGKSEADDLCVLLNFKWGCTVRLKLKVASMVITKTAEKGIGRMTAHKKLLSTQSDRLRLRESPDGSWHESFQVKSAEEGWPTDDKGEKIKRFRVELLLQVERTLKFD